MINIKADREVKLEAQRLAKELGLSLSAVVSASLKQFIRNREIHLDAGLEPSPYLQKVLRKADKDIRAGRQGEPDRSRWPDFCRSAGTHSAASLC